MGAPGGGLTLANVAAHGRRLVAVGSDGLIATATDPRHWTVEPAPARGPRLWAMGTANRNSRSRPKRM
jgi:hypothetical protein